MMAALPQYIRFYTAAKMQQSWRGEIGIDRFPRLISYVGSTDGSLCYNISFFNDQNQEPVMELEVSGKLLLKCERCLEKVGHALHVNARLTSEELSLASLGDAQEISFSVLDVMEDEIILSLPLVVKHKTLEECHPSILKWVESNSGLDDEKAVEKDRRNNPFEMLKKLKWEQ